MKTRFVVLLTALALSTVLPAARAHAQEEHVRQLTEKFRASLHEIAGAVPGVMGIGVVDLTTNELFGVNEALVFPQGSSIKVAVLVELFSQADQGTLSLDEAIPITAAVRTGGSGLLGYFADGTSSLSLHDLAVLMMLVSDNTATNLLIDRVGMDNVNAAMADLGLRETRLQRRMIRPQDSAAGRENVSTPAEAAALMVRIARCDLPMSDESCGALRGILELPKTNPGTIPAGVRVAWKGGSIEGVRAGWGIVNLPGRPYAIAVMANYADGPAAAEAISAVVDASHGFFSKLAGATPNGARVPLRYLSDPP